MMKGGGRKDMIEEEMEGETFVLCARDLILKMRLRERRCKSQQGSAPPQIE
jgi:hypothetical protein